MRLHAGWTAKNVLGVLEAFDTNACRRSTLQLMKRLILAAPLLAACCGVRMSIWQGIELLPVGRVVAVFAIHDTVERPPGFPIRWTLDGCGELRTSTGRELRFPAPSESGCTVRLRYGDDSYGPYPVPATGRGTALRTREPTAPASAWRQRHTAGLLVFWPVLLSWPAPGEPVAPLPRRDEAMAVELLQGRCGDESRGAPYSRRTEIDGAEGGI